MRYPNILTIKCRDENEAIDTWKEMKRMLLETLQFEKDCFGKCYCGIPEYTDYTFHLSNGMISKQLHGIEIEIYNKGVTDLGESMNKFERWAKSIVFHNTEIEVKSLIEWWKTKGSVIHGEGQAMKMVNALETELNNYKKAKNPVDK